MKYFGIKTPETKKDKSYIFWISSDEHKCWSMFLHHPNYNNEINRYHGSISEGIRAYEAIGYKCVELDIKEK